MASSAAHVEEPRLHPRNQPLNLCHFGQLFRERIIALGQCSPCCRDDSPHDTVWAAEERKQQPRLSRRLESVSAMSASNPPSFPRLPFSISTSPVQRRIAHRSHRETARFLVSHTGLLTPNLLTFNHYGFIYIRLLPTVLLFFCLCIAVAE